MAADHRQLVTFARYALLGTLAGVLMGVLGGLAVEKILPPRFMASAIVFHSPGSGWSDSGRDFVAATLAHADFLPGIAHEQGWRDGVAADLVGEIVVTAADASRPLAEIQLDGTDPEALKRTLDAVAQHMVALHQRRQRTDLQAQLDDLDVALADARERVRELGEPLPDRAMLPAAAIDAVTAMARLARQRRELELGKRYRLGRGSNLDERRRELSLHGLERQLERALQAFDVREPGTAAAFERARERATAEAEANALQHIRDGLLREFDAFTPLRLVRAAEVTPLPLDVSPALVLAAFGALAGLLAGGFVWSANQSAPTRLSAARVEHSLRVPVLAVVSADLANAGEQGPLAQTNPQHRAIAAIRSLRIALAVRRRDVGAGEPVVISGLSDPQTARLVVANLAVIAAYAGEHVLIIDEVRDEDGLTQMFAATDNTARYGSGSVRVADGERAADIRASDARFDQTFVHVADSRRALELIGEHTAGVALLVCALDQPLAALRRARANKMFGVVLSGYRIDDAAYRSSAGPAQAS